MDSLGVLFAILSAVCWGIVYTLDQKILYSVSPLLWLAIQSFFSAVILLPVLVFNRSEISTILHSSKLNWLVMAGTLIMVVLGTYFIFIAINRLGAAKANLFEITYPFFVVLFSALLFQDRPNVFFWLGAVLIFLGSLVILKLS